IEGNFLGTDVSGTASFGLRFFGGVFASTSWMTRGVVCFSSFNWIGTNGKDADWLADPGTAAARNLISGNFMGVGVGVGAHDNVMAGNYIGTNARGTAAVGNSYGVLMQSANANLTESAHDNLIEGNLICGNSLAAGLNPSVVGYGGGVVVFGASVANAN